MVEISDIPHTEPEKQNNVMKMFEYILLLFNLFVLYLNFHSLRKNGSK